MNIDEVVMQLPWGMPEGKRKEMRANIEQLVEQEAIAFQRWCNINRYNTVVMGSTAEEAYKLYKEQ